MYFIDVELNMNLVLFFLLVWILKYKDVSDVDDIRIFECVEGFMIFFFVIIGIWLS